MTSEPIMKTLKFDRRMEPFVERARLTHKHYDVGDVGAMNVLERSRKAMNQILLRQKISERKAKCAILETFSIAVNYKLENRRRQQRMLKQKAQGIEILKLLEKVKVIRNTVSHLAQKSRSKLNEVTVKQYGGILTPKLLPELFILWWICCLHFHPLALQTTLAQQSAR